MSGIILTAHTRQQVLQLLEDHPDASILAGGTDIYAELYNARDSYPLIVDISPLQEWAACQQTAASYEIGALCTFEKLAEFCSCPALGCLREAALQAGSPQIRGRGTVGGNIGTASPAGDISVALLALDANVRLCGVTGERILPLKEFFLDNRKTALQSGEVIVGVEIPHIWQHSCYRKLGQRKALAISVVSIAVAYGDSGFSVALGSVYKTPLLAEKTMALLNAYSPNGVLSPEIKKTLLSEIAPIDDTRATAEYRSMAAVQMLEDVVRQLTQEGMSVRD